MPQESHALRDRQIVIRPQIDYRRADGLATLQRYEMTIYQALQPLVAIENQRVGYGALQLICKPLRWPVKRPIEPGCGLLQEARAPLQILSAVGPNVRMMRLRD